MKPAQMIHAANGFGRGVAVRGLDRRSLAAYGSELVPHAGIGCSKLWLAHFHQLDACTLAGEGAA